MRCSRLHSKLYEFRLEEKFCDISIQIQNKTVKCHRVILASISNFFEVMFYSTFGDSKKEEIALHEIDPSAFECILDFAYLDQEPNFLDSTNDVYSVLKASDFLGVHDLIELCISHITNHVSSIRNVCEILEFSCISNYPALSDLLSSYIADNFYTVSQNEEFLVLSYKPLNLVMEKYQLSLNSESIGPLLFRDTDLLLDTIIRWILHKFQERRRYFQDLVLLAEIEKVSKNYLEFISNEYNVKLDGFIDLKSFLEASFADDTKDALPAAVVYKNPLKNSALHVYVKLESPFYDSPVNVFSISKYQSKCQWSSIELKNYPGLGEVQVALDQPHNYMYFLSSRTACASFSSYSNISLNEKKTLEVPHLEYYDSSIMCGFRDESIYLYDRGRDYFGWNPAIRNIVSVLNYKCEIDEWFTVPNLKTNVSCAEMVADHKLVYLIGGKNLDERTSFPKYVQAYDYRTSRWEELTKLRTEKWCDEFCKCCCLNGKIYASDAKKMEVFDHIAGKWMVLSHNNYVPKEMLIEICEMVPLENKLWIFYAESGLNPRELIIFDPDAITWLPYESFYYDLFDSLLDKYEGEILSNRVDEDGIQLPPPRNKYSYDAELMYFNTVVFKPFDVNVVT